MKVLPCALYFAPASEVALSMFAKPTVIKARHCRVNSYCCDLDRVEQGQ